MNKEIERKFLVSGNFKKQATGKSRIIQGFLSRDPERTVRIRIQSNKGYITIKGIGNENGMTRYEFEKEIDLSDAKDLLELCEPGIIDKIRYIVPTDKGLFFEVDEFLGDNKGLILAEIELPAEDTHFPKPDWLGKEVTGNTVYYNAQLSKEPFKKWKREN